MELRKQDIWRLIGLLAAIISLIVIYLTYPKVENDGTIENRSENPNRPEKESQKIPNFKCCQYDCLYSHTSVEVYSNAD